MNEKRFEIDSKIYREIDIRYFLKDKNNELVDSYGDEIYWGDSTNGLKQIVDKLNELSEENKQYQQWLGALREELSLADRDNTALEKENKELKQLIKIFQWLDGGGEYKTEIRIVRDTKGEQDD